MNPLGSVSIDILGCQFTFSPTFSAIQSWEIATGKSSGRLLNQMLSGDMCITYLVDILYSSIDKGQSINVSRDKFANMYLSLTERQPINDIACKLLVCAQSGVPIQDITNKKKDDQGPAPSQ